MVSSIPIKHIFSFLELLSKNSGNLTYLPQYLKSVDLSVDSVNFKQIIYIYIYMYVCVCVCVCMCECGCVF